MGIENLNVIITGAAKGIGKSIAEMMAGRGANVSLCDIQENLMGETAEQIAKTGAKVFWQKVDVSDQDQVTGFIEFSRQKLGGIDVLVNNAGIYILKPIDEISNEEWDKVMLVNVRSCFMFTKGVLPEMRKNKFGRIINMASAAGKNGGTICGSHYAASKGAILAFTRHMARQEAAHGITVNAVAPALIAADMMLNLPPEGRAKAVAGTLVGRLGRVDEVAETVCYLADRNSGFVIGESININGGALMD